MMETFLGWIILAIKLIFAFSVFIWFFRKRTTTFISSLLFLAGLVSLLWAGWDLVTTIFPDAHKLLLGIDKLNDEDLKKAGLPRFISLPPTWVIFLIIIPAVIAFVGIIYAREKKTVDGGVKILLSVIRIAVIAIIILMLFEPNLILQENTKRYSQVLVLLDSSKSMNQRDLYINRWSDITKDGEFEKITQHEAIRSQLAREEFGKLILRKLILDNIQPVQASEDLNKLFNSSDLPIKIQDEYQTEFNLQQLKVYMDAEYELRNLMLENLKLEYVNMLIDFLDTLPDDVLSIQEKTGIRESVNVASTPEKQSEEFFNSLKDKVPEAFYLHLLILDNMIIKNQSFEQIEQDLSRLLSGHFAKFVYVAKRLSENEENQKDFWKKMPREFGMMDSFTIALQFRRMERLFNKMQKLNNGKIALGACVELLYQQANLKRIIDLYKDKIASPDVSEEDVTELTKLSGIYTQFVNSFSDIYKGGFDNNLLTTTLNQLVETSKGLRRIDIALELLHPEANFEGIIDNSIQIEGLKQFKFIANLSSENYSRNGRFNKLDIRTFSEGGVTTELPGNTEAELANSLDSVIADGNRTEIGTSADAALRSMLKRHLDIDHLSSMIIISDGLNNQGLPSTNLMKEIEVNTVAVGSLDTLHHLELFNLQAPSKVSKESDVSITINIQADEAYQRDKFGNPGGKNVEVLLYRVVEHANYEEEIPVRYDNLVDLTPGLKEADTVDFENKKVQLMPVSATQDFILDFTPTKDIHFLEFGQKTHFRLKINRKKYIDEDKYEDNIRDFYITFTNDKIRVLYIEGRPRYEWRYLDTVLKRTKKFLYQCYLTSADSGWPQPISMDTEGAPEGFTNLTEIPRGDDEDSRNRFYESYDVVIIGDVAPHELGIDRMKMLEEFSYKHKGGVVFISGESYMPQAYSNTVLRDLIPVKLSIPSNKKPLPNIEKPWKITAEGLNHDILRISKKLSRDELRELWEEKLHGFFWFFNAPEVKEGAIVLMEHPGKAVVGSGASRLEYDMRTEAGGRGLFPLIVWMDTGKNGVLYFGTDDLWYIRGGQGNKYYAPFWVQVVSYMASRKRDSSAETAEIYTENRNDPVYTHEETIRVFGKIRGDMLEKQLTDSGVIFTNDAGFKTLHALMRNVSIPNSKPSDVILVDRTGKGTFEKMIYPESVGKYEIWIKDMPNSVHRFVIKPPSIELNEELPVNVALLTEISHPRPDNLEAFDTYCYYPPRTSELVVYPMDLSDKKVKKEEDLWDAPLLLILIFALLSAEWIIRKRSKLL